MSVLDICRSHYVFWPRPARAIVGLAARFLPARLRYGHQYSELTRAIQRSWSDASFVERFQTERLRWLITRAYGRCDHITSAVDRVLDGPSGIQSLTPPDLISFPLINRALLAAHPRDFLLSPINRVDERHTSGSSTGAPVRVFLDRDRGVREAAFLHSHWQRFGYRSGQAVAIVRDSLAYRFSHAKPYMFEKGLNELRLSPFHLTAANMDDMLRILGDFRPAVIHGLPSALSILARHAAKRAWRPVHPPCCIVTSSETLFFPQRELLADVFRCPVISHYGLTERTAFAVDRPELPDIFEFEPLYGIAELLDDNGRPITQPGRIGRLVSTGFLNSSMALVRYDTGDRARLVQQPTRANCWRLRVQGIRSKWSQEFVVGKAGNLISVIGLVSYRHAGTVADFQFTQERQGEVTFKAVLYPGLSHGELEPIIRQMKALAGDSINISAEIVPALPTGPGGKRPMVDQRLAIASTNGFESCSRQD
jgi:phenylacetate-CoA ligase